MRTVMNQVDMRNGPVGRFFGTDNASGGANEIQAQAAVRQAVGAGCGVFRAITFIGRHDCKNVEVGPSDFYALIEQAQVILLDVT
jgi:hypothetical protein